MYSPWYCLVNLVRLLLNSHSLDIVFVASSCDLKERSDAHSLVCVHGYIDMIVAIRI